MRSATDRKTVVFFQGKNEHINQSSVAKDTGLDPSFPLLNQQFTYGVVGGRGFAEILGNFAESCKKYVVITSGKGAEILRKVCGDFAKICGTVSGMTPSRRNC